MKRAGWAWSGNRGLADKLLVLAVGVIGVPYALWMAILILQPDDAVPATPIVEVERSIETLGLARYDSEGFAALAQRGPPGPEAGWQNVSLPDVLPLDPVIEAPVEAPMARLWLKARYVPPAGDAGHRQLAVYVTRIMGGAYSVWVDGRLVDANVEDWRMQWNVPVLIKLPLASGRDGNPVEVSIGVPYRLSQGYAFGSMSIGPVAAIQRLHEIRSFWQAWLPRAAILVALLLGLISLGFWVAVRSEREHLLLALTSIDWFVANTQYFGDFRDPATSLWYGALNDAAITWVLPLVTMFALRFVRRRLAWLETVLVFNAAAATILTLPIWRWQLLGVIAQHYVTLALAFTTFSVLTWLAVREGDRSFRLIVGSIWLMQLFGLHDVFYLTSQRAPDHVHLFPYATFFVFGAFLYAMQQRYLGARTALAELNASLDRRLRQREAELAELHGKQLAQEQERVLQDERQRIMRDMHDGVGTVLMSSLAMAEQGRLPAERTAVVLRDSLDQIKLVIDSLEPVENDIVALLANLRYRFGQRVEEAGVHIDWAMEELPRLPWLDAGASLHVLRIVQEAVTNTLKHAGASQLRIAARVEEGEAEPEIAIVIADDGRGFDPAGAGRGRGLRNLRYRAEQLGGRLRIRSTPGEGTVIELRLPLAGRTAST
jgi:signal transduction histidine kinase